MSEHEIFNSDEDDVLVETKKQKTSNNFWANLFSFEMLPVALSLCAMFLTLFTYLLPAIGSVTGGIIFMILAFCSALASLVVALIPMIKNKKLVVNLQIILALAAVIISLPIMF